MNYYIMTTQEEANTCRAECYASHMAHHSDSADYTAGTTEWSREQVREDGKYIVPVCTHYKNPHRFIMETSHPDWFPQEEI